MTTTNTILKGVNRLANTVKVTLGTKGRTVLFNDENNRTHITKDGVTVARNIVSDDDYENMIITVLRESSLKTMKSSGDGTTTTVILAQYIINEGLRLIEEGLTYYEISKQIDNAVADVTEYIKSRSISIEDNMELLREIAAISSNDEKLGDYIYSIVEDIGIYGHIEVKDSHYSEIRTDKTKGMKLYKGWIENFMINDPRELSFKADNCHILIIDDNLQAMTDIGKYVEHLAGKPLLVFCNDITDITLSQIKRWLEATGSPTCFVQNDGYGERKQILMNDLAALTSAYVIGAQDKFNSDNLGFAGQIKVDELYTSVLDGDSDEDLIEDILYDVKTILKDDEEDDELNLSGVDRVFHRKRLANLTGGVAVIIVKKIYLKTKEEKDIN